MFDYLLQTKTELLKNPDLPSQVFNDCLKYFGTGFKQVNRPIADSQYSRKYIKIFLKKPQLQTGPKSLTIDNNKVTASIDYFIKKPGATLYLKYCINKVILHKTFFIDDNDVLKFLLIRLYRNSNPKNKHKTSWYKVILYTYLLQKHPIDQANMFHIPYEAFDYAPKILHFILNYLFNNSHIVYYFKGSAQKLNLLNIC